MKSMRYAESSPSRKTTMRRALVLATALVFGAPATSAFAHDPGEYQGFFNHFYDHLEHQQFHQQFNDEHNAAHWQGFANPQQHRDWHGAYGATHGQFHEDHPDTSDRLSRGRAGRSWRTRLAPACRGRLYDTFGIMESIQLPFVVCSLASAGSREDGRVAAQEPLAWENKIGTNELCPTGDPC